MNDDPRTEHLKEWNRLSRENTENAMVSSMFEAGLNSSETIAQFSTWLLVGTAAIASFFIANSDKVLPLISKTGFLFCGAFLCLSCIAGFISKIYAVRCYIANKASVAVQETFIKQLEKHNENEEKIKESAKNWGITLQTGIRMERVMNEFFKPLPKIVVWFAKRNIEKHKGDPQIGYLPRISMINRQGLFAIFQSIFFLAFLLSGFIYAAI